MARAIKVNTQPQEAETIAEQAAQVASNEAANEAALRDAAKAQELGRPNPEPEYVPTKAKKAYKMPDGTLVEDY